MVEIAGFEKLFNLPTGKIRGCSTISHAVWFFQ